MARIFISYSRVDVEFASRLAADLDRLGASVWIDVDHIPPGVNWSTAIQQGLDECDVLILIISPESIASSNVIDEWQYVRDEGKPIIPILWRPTDRMHFQLRRIQYVNFHNQPHDRALHQLHARLNDHGDSLHDLPPLEADKELTGALRPITPRTARQLVTLRTIDGHNASVTCTAFSPDSLLIASGSEDKTVRLWYPTQRKRLKVMIGHEKQVNALAFSPSGVFLASASDDRTVRIWHVGKRYGVSALRGHTAPVTAVAYSPTETLLASASEDGTVRLWNAYQWTLAATLDEHQGPVHCLMFSPDGSALASAGGDLVLRLWDVTGHGVITDYNLPDEARCMAFSPDGTLLAVGLADHGLLVLAVQQHEILGAGDDSEPVTLEPVSQIDYSDYNARCVRGAAFSPDGSVFAMAALDGILRLWNVDDLRKGTTTRALKVLRGHEGGVTGAAFSPDGLLLVSASHDSTLRVWQPEV